MQRKKRWKTAGILAAAMLIAVWLKGCVATSYLIPSAGMENSLYQGERILVNKWSYGLRVPLMRWFGYHRWGRRPVQRDDILVFNNPSNWSQPVVDRREVFISRCLGLPGDTLTVDSLFCVVASDGNAPDRKSLYAYPREREREMDSLLTLLSIRHNNLLGEDSTRHIRSFSRYEHYLLEQAMSSGNWITPLGQEDSARVLLPLVVPQKGKPVQVYPWNRMLLCNTLALHEGRKAVIHNDTLYVEGVATSTCCFTRDYYWMEADNPTNPSDSRLFGFVPEDHLIGKATLIWFSKDQGKGVFTGYRWDRMWKWVE